MSSKSPIFPMSQPQHFSDYGFDPQIDYFQVLEEARKHKRDHYSTTTTATTRSIDSIHFKLSKPISKDDYYHHHHHNSKKSHHYSKKKRWWRNAILFFKWKWTHNNNVKDRSFIHNNNGFFEDVHQARARAFRATSISGPVYITESLLSGPTTPRRSSGPLGGALSPMDSDDVASDIPYVSLRQLNMEQQRVSTSTMPIYLVT